MPYIIDLETHDIRFPTSRQLDGSDAMNPDPDYSAAYVVLRTDDSDGLCGCGFVFTIGRGNDVQTAALAALPDKGLPSEAWRDALVNVRLACSCSPWSLRNVDDTETSTLGTRYTASPVTRVLRPVL